MVSTELIRQTMPFTCTCLPCDYSLHLFAPPIHLAGLHRIPPQHLGLQSMTMGMTHGEVWSGLGKP
jgi:hypothetical protein